VAKFILGNAVRKKAQKIVWLRKVLWAVDFLLVGSVVKLLGLLPVDLASSLGRGLGKLFSRLISRKNDKVRDNLRIALPEKSSSEINNLVSEIWGNAGAVLAEYAHLDYLSNIENGRLEIKILEDISTYSEPTNQAVFVVVHQSNWELAASAIAHFGIKFVSLYSPPYNPWLDNMLKKSRRALGCELLPRDVTMRPLFRALSENRSVAMVVDRRIDEGMPIPFFGHDKLTTLLPARLALKFSCPLVPIKMERLKGAKFRATFYPPIKPHDLEGDSTDQATEMMIEVNELFASWIKENPGEWFCSKRLWPKSKINSVTTDSADF